MIHADLKAVESLDASTEPSTEQSPPAEPKPPRARPNWSEVETRQLIIDRQESELQDRHRMIVQQEGVIGELEESLAYARQETDAVRRGYRKWQLPLLCLGALLYALGEAAVRAWVAGGAS